MGKMQAKDKVHIYLREILMGEAFLHEIEKWLIEVEDEGMGIPAEELHKIYQRFYRGRKAKEQVKDGAGVGLYLARKIIEEQGGTIAAKRKAEKGMIFKVTLPLIIGE